MAPSLPLDEKSIFTATQLLAAGDLVAFPTETVYGLGADARNGTAVAKIFAAKGRPSFNPLISHVATADAAFALGQETDIALALATAFWPGPLTLILHRADDCPIALLTSAGLDKIAVRVPAHSGAQRLLHAFDGPIAAPSANPSGQISPSRAAHVIAGLGDKVPLILDDGPCESGIESTIVDCTGPIATILRPGGITRTEISAVLSAAGLASTAEASAPIIDQQSPASPGQMESHYAPTKLVRLNVTTPLPDDEFIGFGAISGQGELNLTLSHSGDLAEAAANLFEMLHAADASSRATLAIAPIPQEGLGEAINDRLSRAAAPRPT